MQNLVMLFLVLVGSQSFAVTPYDPLPTTVLSCGGGLITSIGGRLEGDRFFETGASVVLNNRGAGVAYQNDPSIPAISKSRVGDHMLVCLVFVPKDCPAGDFRGRVYTMTNLRTLESWTLPDSGHMCGGA